MKKPEKEYAKVSDVDMLSGGKAIRIEAVISLGKFEALKSALELYGLARSSEVAKDLLGIIIRADKK